MRKRKALKGGYIIANPTSAGPILKEGLISRDDKDIKGLQSIYEIKYNEAKRDLDRLTKLKKINNDAYDEYTQRVIAYEKLDNDVNKTTWKKISDMSSGALKNGRAFGNFLKNLVIAVIKIFLSLLKTVGTFIFMGGQGAIIKVLIAIFILLVAIGFITSGFSGVNSKDIDSSSDVGKDILKRDNDDYLKNLNQTNNNFITRMYDWFKSLLPNSYLMGLSSISNSLTYITTGKNQFDEYLDDRDEIKTGRSDNIFHVNFTDITNINNNINSNNTYSIIEPKDVILEFNENLYYNSDYSKITKNIKDVIKYPTKCAIPIIPNPSGKYSLNIANIKYYNSANELISSGKTELIKSIFKKEEGKDKNTGVKLNSFNNILYTNYFNAKNALGTYGTRLINPNYKGPILRLCVRYDDSDIRTKTIDFYNDYYDNNDKKIYCIIDNKKIYYDKYFTENEQSFIDVRTLYDQSGNNKHFSYSSTALIREPRLRKNTDTDTDSYYLAFSDRRILVLSNQISYKKITIYTKIKINYNDTRINKGHDQLMHFLYRKDENTGIYIAPNGEKTTLAFSYSNTNNYIYEIPKAKISDIQEISIKDISNTIDGGDVILESLGNSEDIRHKGKDRSQDKYGANRAKNLDNHSLDAHLYELIIYKSDD